jgi:hypothetical protein
MRKNLLALAACCLFILAAITPAEGSAGDAGTITITQLKRGVYSLGDTLTFSGTNTDSDTTYLFITGPNLDAKGSQIQSTHPRDSPVIDGDASTFLAASRGAGTTWSWTWDSQKALIDTGMYTVYAASRPRDIAHIKDTHYAKISFIMKRPANAPAIAGAESDGGSTANTGGDESVTILQPESGRYPIGDTLTFSGTNTDSATTYLFITGPNLDPAGSRIQSSHPRQYSVIDGDASTFLAAGVGPDKQWSYTWNSRKALIDAGVFWVFAASSPRDLPHINETHYAKVAFVMARPANIEPADGNLSRPSVVMTGDRITISGTAKGNPGVGVAIWIIGAPGSGRAGYADLVLVLTDSTGFYSLDIDGAAAGLEEGRYHVIVQHPMQNNVFDICLANVTAGNSLDGWVLNRMLTDNNAEGTRIFKIRGAGSLQGDDAYEALVQAFEDPAVDDTIAIFPSTVNPTGSAVNSPEENAVTPPRKGFSDTESPAGPAFEIDTIVVDPAGDLASGTPVTVSYRVNISGTNNGETFPPADELQMSTGLENPQWASTLVLDGVENPRPGFNGRILMVSGWLLSYPSSVSEYLKVTLSGTTPRVQSPANVTLFTVTEYDSHANPIAGSEISRSARNNPGTDQSVLSGTGVQAHPAMPVTTMGTVIEKLRAGFSTVTCANPGSLRAPFAPFF